MRRIVVGTVCSARRYNADWRLLLFHGTDLYTGRMRPDHISRVHIKFLISIIIDVERVLHLAGRVVRRHIECVKVMELVFNVRAFSHFKSHLGKNSDNFFINFGNRMDSSLRFRPAGKGNVNNFLFQLFIQLFGFQFLFFFGNFCFNFRFDNINLLSERNSFFHRHAAQCF